MKNYVAKLRENEEKGFSLVELIIVMAIMAILVGVVASQVIPYMEKSRQSKDQQQVSSIATTLVSAIAQNPDSFNQGNVTDKTKLTVTATDGLAAQLQAVGGAKTGLIGTAATSAQTVEDTFCELMGYKTWADFAKDYITKASQKKYTSKEAKENITGLDITLGSKGDITVQIAGTTSTKLKVTSE